MSALETLTVAILAAGLSTRFGGNKLEHEVSGLPLALHIGRTIAGLPFAEKIAICSSGEGLVPQGFRELGITVLVNPNPADGQSGSLALAGRAAAATAGHGLLICLADMPYVGSELLTRIAETWAADRTMPVVTVAGDYRGPPALLPRSMFDIVGSLTGDRGARGLLKTANAVIADPTQVRDIDRPSDLP